MSAQPSAGHGCKSVQTAMAVGAAAKATTRMPIAMHAFRTIGCLVATEDYPDG